MNFWFQSAAQLRYLLHNRQTYWGKSAYSLDNPIQYLKDLQIKIDEYEALGERLDTVRNKLKNSVFKEFVSDSGTSLLVGKCHYNSWEKDLLRKIVGYPIRFVYRGPKHNKNNTKAENSTSVTIYFRYE